MISAELKQILTENGYSNIRYIEGRGVCALHKFIFTTGLLYGLDATGYKGRWCYENPGHAMVAIEIWDGVGDPPLMWIKYKGEGGERFNDNQ